MKKIVAAVCKLWNSAHTCGHGGNFMDVKLSFDCFTPLILHSYHNPIVFQSLGVNVNLNLFYSFHSFSKSVGVYENFRSIVYGDFPWNWSFPFFPSFFFFAIIVWTKNIYGTNRPFRLPSRFWNWSLFYFVLTIGELFGVQVINPYCFYYSDHFTSMLSLKVISNTRFHSGSGKSVYAIVCFHALRQLLSFLTILTCLHFFNFVIDYDICLWLCPEQHFAFFIHGSSILYYFFMNWIKIYFVMLKRP